MEPAKLFWKFKRSNLMGNEMETPRENDKLTLEQPAQGIDEKIHKDSKPSELKLNPHKNKRLTKDSVFPLTRADGNDDEIFLPTKGEGSEVGKVKETRFSLSSSWTRRQGPADPTSHRKQHSLTSLSENHSHPNFRWT